MSGNTLGISSIGPYWNLKSVNYFKENIHFFLVIFFIETISGKQIFFKKIRKSTDSVGKGFNIAQHNAVVGSKKTQKYLWTLFLGACTSLCYGHIYDTL